MTLTVRTTCLQQNRTVRAKVIARHPRFVVVEIEAPGGRYREAFPWGEVLDSRHQRQSRDDAIVEMYREGYTYEQIARSVKVSYHVVWERIKKATDAGKVARRRRYQKGA